MRKTNKVVYAAFWNFRKLKMDNTEVKPFDNKKVELYLHGSCIARAHGSRLEVNPQGYLTQTTQSRLNTIISHVGASITQKNGMWFITYWKGGEQAKKLMDEREWFLVYPGSVLEQFVHEVGE